MGKCEKKCAKQLWESWTTIQQMVLKASKQWFLCENWSFSFNKFRNVVRIMLLYSERTTFHCSGLSESLQTRRLKRTRKMTHEKMKSVSPLGPQKVNDMQLLQSKIFKAKTYANQRL